MNDEKLVAKAKEFVKGHEKELRLASSVIGAVASVALLGIKIKGDKNRRDFERNTFDDYLATVTKISDGAYCMGLPDGKKELAYGEFLESVAELAINKKGVDESVTGAIVFVKK